MHEFAADSFSRVHVLLAQRMSSIADSSAGAAGSALQLDAHTVVPAVAAAAESSVPCAADSAPIDQAPSSSLPPLASPMTDAADAASSSEMGQMSRLGPDELQGMQGTATPPSEAQINAILAPIVAQIQAQTQLQSQSSDPQQPLQQDLLSSLFQPGTEAWNLASNLLAQGINLSAINQQSLALQLPPLEPPPQQPPNPSLDPSTLQLISSVTRTPGLKQQAKSKSHKKKQDAEEEQEQAPKSKNRGRDRARAAAVAPAAAAAADSKPPESDPPPTLSASGRPQRSAALRRKRVLSDDDSYDDEKASDEEDEEDEGSEADVEEDEDDEDDELAGESEDEAYNHAQEYTRRRSYRSAPQRKKASAAAVNRRAPFTRVRADQDPAAADPQVKQEPESESDADRPHRRELTDAEMDPGSEYTGEDSSRDHSLSRAQSSAASSRMATPAHGRPFAVADKDGMFHCKSVTRCRAEVLIAVLSLAC